MANPVVIDISHHQPDPIDWAKVKAGGTVGVIHKATEGTSYVDDKLFKRARAAMDAGLCWATYHFLRSSNWQAQMQHYLGVVSPRQGERVCLDHERYSDGSCMSLGNLLSCVSYIQTVRPDLQITIYSGNLIKEQLGSVRNEPLAEGTSLWLAHYTTDTPTWPKETWPQWSLWQHTDKGSVSGVNGNVDANKWNGSAENLIAWFGPTAPAPAPEPEPEPADMPELTIATKGKMRITINDQIIICE